MSTDTSLSTPAPGDGFVALGVPTTLAAVLAAQGITTPTPIQAATLPDSLAGRDVLGRGRTGSGKTLAFLLPLVTRLAAGSRPGAPGAARTPRTPRRPRALILAPTRELVGQIDTALQPLAARSGLTSVTIFGGVGKHPQVTALRRGVDVLVACPGRLLDLMGEGHVDLTGIELTVLDEADHMADLGFLPGVRRILDATPARAQRLLFSATLDAGVGVLVKRFLSDPVTHHADSGQPAVSTMEHHVLHVAADDRLPVLLDLTAAPGRSVVFTRTKHGAKKLTRQLNASGVPAVELHGNLSQGARTRTMDAFHSGSVTTLVATDIAARGIHVDEVGLVIHADPPTEHKAYLHRSGRTARAGASGLVVTLATDEQMGDVRTLTRKAGVRPTTTRVDATHPLLARLVPGERVHVEPSPVPATTESRRPGAPRPARSGSGSSAGRGRPGRSGEPRRGGPRSGAGRDAAGATPRTGAGRPRRSAPAASGPRHEGRSSSGGGAAAFSAGTRAGSRRSR